MHSRIISIVALLVLAFGLSGCTVELRGPSTYGAPVHAAPVAVKGPVKGTYKNGNFCPDSSPNVCDVAPLAPSPGWYPTPGYWGYGGGGPSFYIGGGTSSRGAPVLDSNPRYDPHKNEWYSEAGDYRNHVLKNLGRKR